MVVTRSAAKLKQSEGPSAAAQKQVKTPEPKAPASPPVQKRGAAAKRRPAPKKDVKELQVARQSLREAMNLLAEKTSNVEEETAKEKNQKGGKKLVAPKGDKEIPTSQNGKAAAKQPDPSTATDQKPTKKPIKKKTTRKPRTKATSPVKSSDEENKPVRTSAGYLTISDQSPRREPSINLTKVRSNIKQQPLKPQADGKRKN